MAALDQQTIIVTGASAGIGEAIVRRLIRIGANVVLFARRRERLDALVAEIDPAHRRTLIVSGDITEPSDRERLVAETLARFGRIDGLVNNAGYGQRGPIERVPLDAIRRNFETNVFALLGLTQLVAPLMRERGRGRIVIIGSVAGRIARPFSSTYDATKHALEAFSVGLRGELKPFGVHVSLVRPGFILTEFIAAADAASGDTMDNAGPYAPFVAEHRKGVKSMRRVAGKSDDIAKVVERALVSAHPKIHYAAPFHAKVLLFLNWILPAAWVDAVTGLKKK